MEADALWEASGEEQIQRSRSRTIPTATPGQLLGSGVTGGAYFDLHKPSMVADLPFSRALSGEADQKRRVRAFPSHTARRSLLLGHSETLCNAARQLRL